MCCLLETYYKYMRTVEKNISVLKSGLASIPHADIHPIHQPYYTYTYLRMIYTNTTA